MTPNNSREVSLSLSRDRLARALSKLDRLSRDAAETIASLRAEKNDLEAQLQYQSEVFEAEKAELQTRAADLTRLFEQERSNFEQRAILLQSVASEAEERTRSLDDLTRRHADLEGIIRDQLETIARLESELNDHSVSLAKRDESTTELGAEIQELRATIAQLEERAERTAAERDELKSQLYENERQNAQWALKLSTEERDQAAKAIDSLIDQLANIETRIASDETAAH